MHDQPARLDCGRCNAPAPYYFYKDGKLGLPECFYFYSLPAFAERTDKRKKIKFSPIRPVRLIPELYLKHHIVELSNFFGEILLSALDKSGKLFIIKQ